MHEALVKVEPQATQARPAESTLPKEDRQSVEAREAMEGREVMEAREARQAMEVKEAKEAKKAKEAREAREARETMEAKDTKEAREAREAMEEKEAKEPRKDRKKSRYIREISHSVIRFRRKKRKAGAISSGIKNSGEENDNLVKICGLGWLVIPSCHRFNNIHCFMVFYCILVVSQGTVFSLVDLSINTLQSGNLLRTTESIVLSSSYGISSCLVVLFISYYGGRGNIVKWITVSSFLVGFGSLLFAFPYTTGEDYQLDIETEDICDKMKVMKTCKKSISFESKYVSFFLLGQTVQGVAGMPLYILGMCFIDEKIATHSAGIYLGLVESSVLIGYALGYAIAAPLHGDIENSAFPNSVEDRDNNKHWLQTWWIRFVFVSVLAWSTLVPLSCFSEDIQGTATMNTGKHRKLHVLDRLSKDQESETSLKDLFASIWILMKTPIFICLALSRASDSLLIIGTSEILPKYLENQFILSPNQAATLSGFVLIPGAALGQLLGGVIASKLHMYCKGYMRFIMVTSTVSLVLVVFSIFVHCNPIPFAGINEDYGGTGNLGDLTAPCNSGCRCSTFHSPVCGRDNIGYFSPCFAGCVYSKTTNHRKTYFNCSCIIDGLTDADDEGDFIDARSGRCDTKCYKLPLFIVVIFSTLIFACFSGIPNMLTILRIVPEKQRCVALGLTYVILRVFGSIPGPIVFKMIGESSCTFWNRGRCEKREHCWIYNKTKMAYLVLGTCFFCKVFTIFFTAIAFSIYKCLLKERRDLLSVPVKILKFKKKEKKARTDL